MMNKKGSLVLRDIVFMMITVSAIFVLCGIFVSDMAIKYENTNMTSEWAGTGTTKLANSTFYSVGSDVTDTGDGLSQESTGILSLVLGGLEGVGKAMFMVLNAPSTIGDLVSVTLIDMNVNSTVAGITNYLIVIVLWAIIIFTVISAFLRGGKL